MGHFDGRLVEGSGTSGLHQDEQGKWRKDPTMSMYTLRLETLPAELSEARFIEVGRPNVKVNKAESRQQKKRRIAQVGPKPLQHQTPTQCIGLPPTCAKGHRAHGPRANHALTFKLDHSSGAAHSGKRALGECNFKSSILKCNVTQHQTALFR